MGEGQACKICGISAQNVKLLPGALVIKGIADLIHTDYPDWSANDFICSDDLVKYRNMYLTRLLKTEQGELGEVENDVLNSIKQNGILARNIDRDADSKKTTGEKIADKVAEFGGSWKFIIIFFVFLFIWISLNVIALLFQPFDPYPFILLNLMLSCLAAIQAPVILMSQNRKEAKDRIHAENDYRINLKSELEIRHLDEKINHMIETQWERLAEIQGLLAPDAEK